MNYVIIGNSAAGIACIEAIRSKDKKSGITVISKEDYHIYSRCLLSYYLAGDIKEERLVYRPDDFYKTREVTPLLGCSCEKILTKERRVKIEGKKEIGFDKLLIATGSHPNFPKIKGSTNEGVMGLRTVQDAKKMLELLKGAKTIAILGGGLIGLKSAYGLSTHNKDVRVIVKSDQVLSQVIDKKAAAIFQAWIEKRGIKVMTGLAAQEIIGKDKAEGIILDNGGRIDCQMVVVGKGVEPNLELARGSDIKVDYGILVDEHLMTNVDGIFAAGDAAQGFDRVTQDSRVNALWPVAVEEGRAAGLNMAGEKTRYEGSMGMNSVEFFGLPLISMGITRPKEGCKELVYEDKAKGVYKKVVLKDGVAVGMIFVNDIKNAGVVGNLIRNRIDVSGIGEAMLDENFDFAKVADLIKDNKDKFSTEEFRDITLTY